MSKQAIEGFFFGFIVSLSCIGLFVKACKIYKLSVFAGIFGMVLLILCLGLSVYTYYHLQRNQL